LSQYGFLHFGQTRGGLSYRGTHSWVQRPHWNQVVMRRMVGIKSPYDTA